MDHVSQNAGKDPKNDKAKNRPDPAAEHQTSPSHMARDEEHHGPKQDYCRFSVHRASQRVFLNMLFLFLVYTIYTHLSSNYMSHNIYDKIGSHDAIRAQKTVFGIYRD